MFMVMRYGPAVTPWLFVAVLVAEVLVRGIAAAWPVVLLACAWLAIVYAGAAVLLQRVLGFDGRFVRLRDASLFVGIGACAALIAGVVYIGIFTLAGVVSVESLARTVASVLDRRHDRNHGHDCRSCSSMQGRAGRRVPSAASRSLAQTAAIVVALWIVFGSGRRTELKLFYVLFLPLIWIAMRRGMAGTAVASLAVQVGLIAGLSHGRPRGRRSARLPASHARARVDGTVPGRHRGRAPARRSRSCATSSSSSTAACGAAAASELASTLAHELNQPLSAVASYTRSCQLLLERGDPERRAAGDHGRRSCQRQPARAPSCIACANSCAAATMRREMLAPARLLANAAEAARPRASRHGVAIRLDAGTSCGRFRQIAFKSKLVLHNLIANAIDALKNARDERSRSSCSRCAADEAIRPSHRDRQRSRRCAARIASRCSSRSRATRPRVSVSDSRSAARSSKRTGAHCGSRLQQPVRRFCSYASRLRNDAERAAQSAPHPWSTSSTTMRACAIRSPPAAPARLCARSLCDGEAFLDASHEPRVDARSIVLLDLRLPGLSGAQVQSRARAARIPRAGDRADGPRRCRIRAQCAQSRRRDFIEKPVQERDPARRARAGDCGPRRDGGRFRARGRPTSAPRRAPDATRARGARDGRRGTPQPRNCAGVGHQPAHRGGLQGAGDGQARRRAPARPHSAHARSRVRESRTVTYVRASATYQTAASFVTLA